MGCGIGGTAVDLAASGWSVYGFAPSASLVRYARDLAADRNVSDHARFEAHSLQDVTGPPADVVFSQESLQYIHPIREALQRLWELTSPGGRLVVGDQVLRDFGRRGVVQFHGADEIRSSAAAAGFQLVHQEDVTSLAAPTVSHSLRFLRDHRNAIAGFFEGHCPSIREDLDVCLANGAEEALAYEQGQVGYELFAWDRAPE